MAKSLFMFNVPFFFDGDSVKLRDFITLNINIAFITKGASQYP